jgi:hypothetical protein
VGRVTARAASLDKAWEVALGAHEVNAGKTLNLNTIWILTLDRAGRHKDAVADHLPPVTPPMIACHGPFWQVRKGLYVCESKNREVVEQVTQSKCVSYHTPLSVFIATKDT